MIRSRFWRPGNTDTLDSKWEQGVRYKVDRWEEHFMNFKLDEGCKWYGNVLILKYATDSDDPPFGYLLLFG